MTYTYDPENLKEKGKDLMRFELGDTMIDGGADTTAVSDEEIKAMLSMYPNNWKRAKLAILESIYKRFSYEVTEKIGPLTQEFGERVKIWREDYLSLKKELRNSRIPRFNPFEAKSSGYFYSGMMQNPEAGDSNV